MLKSDNKIIGLVLVGRSRIDQVHANTITEVEQQVKLYRSNMMLFSVKDEKEVDDVLAGASRKGFLDGIIMAGLMTPGVVEKVADELLKCRPDSILFATERLASAFTESLRKKDPDYLKEIKLITVGTESSTFPGVEHIYVVAINWHRMVRTALELLLSRIENPHFPPRFKEAGFEIV